MGNREIHVGRQIRFTFIAAAILAVGTATSAFAADPLYVIRPPASVGMKSAGVLPNDAFAPTSGADSGGSTPDEGVSDGFDWKSDGWEWYEGVAKPAVHSARVYNPLRFPLKTTDCTFDGGEFFNLQITDDSVLQFMPLKAGRYGLVITCHVRELQSLVYLADVRVAK